MYYCAVLYDTFELALAFMNTSCIGIIKSINIFLFLLKWCVAFFTENLSGEVCLYCQEKCLTSFQIKDFQTPPNKGVFNWQAIKPFGQFSDSSNQIKDRFALIKEYELYTK